ncbi:thioredoxin family protein [Pseudobacter ginsenosidimutans]|uniref:Thiol-disulfide isomerase/thioredoxin n=1 Tax=Pseudobacter ginsenosidimutans TaxID=661488 RepID=A0A4Q7MRZ9_9BACT|nr:thioredoxin family protein [Pseudobacter ginsenosidimutans]QEC41820.1 thioredoxin family protein [Pseudobacter ginsenosidimutans]RZS71367.1 thiol-disulfide isomerase/thioredoxin [Pseudobacter ginsenosidimutans]
MKYLLSALFVVITLSSFAQTQYEVIEKSGRRILKGIINRDLLANDTTFKWFRQQQEGYKPDTEIVSNIKSKAAEVQYLVFGGTWCGDTRFLLPKFYSLLDAAGVNEDRVSLVAVDYSKKTIGNLSEAFNIQRVPTFIVLKDGKEVGRVVEYGTTGQWDKEISEIVSGKK